VWWSSSRCCCCYWGKAGALEHRRPVVDRDGGRPYGVGVGWRQMRVNACRPRARDDVGVVERIGPFRRAGGVVVSGPAA